LRLGKRWGRGRKREPFRGSKFKPSKFAFPSVSEAFGELGPQVALYKPFPVPYGQHIALVLCVCVDVLDAGCSKPRIHAPKRIHFLPFVFKMLFSKNNASLNPDPAA
jgi:hypothetical protein